MNSAVPVCQVVVGHADWGRSMSSSDDSSPLTRSSQALVHITNFFVGISGVFVYVSEGDTAVCCPVLSTVVPAISDMGGFTKSVGTSLFHHMLSLPRFWQCL